MKISLEDNLICCGDCYDVLKHGFISKVIDLVYADIPAKRKKGIEYDEYTSAMFEEIKKGGIRHYLSWVETRLEQCHRVLKPGGTMYLHCNQDYVDYIKLKMNNIFGGRDRCRNRIVWSVEKKSGRPRRHDLTKKYDMILRYVKIEKPSDKKLIIFNKEIIQDYNKRQGVEINGDVWKIDLDKRDKESYHRRRKPKNLVELVMLLSTNENDIVLDPMCSNGQTLEIAQSLGRRYVGIDISPTLCKYVLENMKQYGNVSYVESTDLKQDVNEMEKLGLRKLEKLKPNEFEFYICDIVGARRSLATRDMGIDGMYPINDPQIAISIKKREKVGREFIDGFETAIRRIDKKQGLVIAFSFSHGKDGAYEEAARAKDDGLEIRLVKVCDLIEKDYNLYCFLE